MNPTIDSIVNKAIELSTHCTKVESLIITSAAALTSGAPEGSINECLSIATENSNAVLNGLDDIQIAVKQLAINEDGGISTAKIKRLSRDAGEVCCLLGFIIDGVKADEEADPRYENALLAVAQLLSLVHADLFELGGAGMTNLIICEAALEPRQRNQSLTKTNACGGIELIAEETTTFVYVFACVLKAKPERPPMMVRAAACTEGEARAKLQFAFDYKMRLFWAGRIPRCQRGVHHD